MQLVALTPDKKLFSGEIISVTLPGKEGRFEILDNHAPMVAALGPGEVRITSSEGQTNFNINGGFIEVADNEVSLLIQSMN